MYRLFLDVPIISRDIVVILRILLKMHICILDWYNNADLDVDTDADADTSKLEFILNTNTASGKTDTITCIQIK